MKLLIQRVKSAKVTVDELISGEIKHGLLLYVCFENNDDLEVIEQSIKKICHLRIFEDNENKMNQNIKQVKGEILSVSQFTLSWDGKKGHRPSFDKSMAPNQAKILYRHFNDGLSREGIKVEKGQFGKEMQVTSQNDGPVTFFLDF